MSALDGPTPRPEGLTSAESETTPEPTGAIANAGESAAGSYVDLFVSPTTIKAAKAWVKELHRHLKVVGWGRFAVAITDRAGDVRGVGIVGNGPQVWEGTTKMVITRVATDGVANGCSMIYGALCRAGKALGYTEAWTYTLPEEPGTSLKAAGFKDMGLTDGGEWTRPSRARRTAVRPEQKRRWLRVLAGRDHFDHHTTDCNLGSIFDGKPCQCARRAA